MARDRVTIADVAHRAGVSVGTVSAVLNNRPTVRERTRRRVLAAIDELGYQPSPSARALAATQGDGNVFERAIGLIIKEVDNPFYAEVVIGAQEYLAARGYLSFVCTSEGSYEKEGELLKAFRNRFVQGAVIAPILDARADLSHLFMLRRAEYPFVLLEAVQGLPVNVVSVDNVRAAQRAAAYLLQGGHERIVHFAGPPYTQHTRDRILGTEKAFSQSHLRFTDDVIIPAGAHLHDGYEAAMKYFGARRRLRPTGVTCFNDLVAMGVLRALHELGIRVPDEVSVVGFDDIPQAAYLSTPLTTVRVPKREMGERAAALLLAWIEARDKGTAGAPRHIVLEAELVERASTRTW
ncbi:LacI family transcriptional regulator [Rhodocaloribacter litoris]|uniref:LacI family DNA-binding transcriptional regulator n=1 Tax=Rhodocaloribacter litoris TaxID=2558931 RepID=UPI001423B84F|nr:LacI family DNA-binding transcriptional regulator [Rhodocaloribacter litoris]QXD14027.1 LacI family transcriptional regulator [Rhodocaloribacter litoris]